MGANGQKSTALPKGKRVAFRPAPNKSRHVHRRLLACVLTHYSYTGNRLLKNDFYKSISYGRRTGLKIPRPQGHPGSSPGSGTRVFFLGNSALFRCRRASAIRRMGLKVPFVYKSLVPSAACKAQPSNGPYTLLTRSAKESSAVVAALPPERRRQRAARSGSTPRRHRSR